MADFVAKFYFDEMVQAANLLGLSYPSIGNGKGKAYEGWVLLELLVNFRHEGAAFEVRLPDGHPTTDLVLPGSPAGMAAASSTGSQAWTHVHVSCLGREFELHAGLQCKGLSGASHELDLAAVCAIDGQACRAAGGGKYAGVVFNGIELKAYHPDGDLDQGIPRAVLGVATDFADVVLERELIAKSFTIAWRRRRARFALVTTTTLAKDSEKLLRHHQIEFAVDVDPVKPASISTIAKMLCA